MAIEDSMEADSLRLSVKFCKPDQLIISNGYAAHMVLKMLLIMGITKFWVNLGSSKITFSVRGLDAEISRPEL